MTRIVKPELNPDQNNFDLPEDRSQDQAQKRTLKTIDIYGFSRAVAHLLRSAKTRVPRAFTT